MYLHNILKFLVLNFELNIAQRLGLYIFRLEWGEILEQCSSAGGWVDQIRESRRQLRRSSCHDGHLNGDWRLP